MIFLRVLRALRGNFHGNTHKEHEDWEAYKYGFEGGMAGMPEAAQPTIPPRKLYTLE